MTATRHYCKSKSSTAPQLVRNRSAVTDAAAWPELMSMIHHCYCRLDKSSGTKTQKQVLMNHMQVIMPAFHGRSSTLVSCDVCTQDDSVVCCSVVQAANADLLRQGDVLVTLCVTCGRMLMYVGPGQTYHRTP